LGSDVVAAKSIVTIPPGETDAKVELRILGDRSFETDETFKVKLSSPDGAKLSLNASEASVTLLNDDSEPVVYFQDSLQKVQENRVEAQVTIAVDEPSGFDTEITVDVGGTAVEGDDFSLMAGKSIKIPAGQASVDYPVNIVEDEVAEFGETLVVTMKSPVNAVMPASDQRNLFNKHTLVITGEAEMNDTGVTTFSDGLGGVGLPSEPGQAPGQDASHGRDVAFPDSGDGSAGYSFTKIDVHGNELADSATTWTCVRDNVTGLVWEVKAPPVSPPSADQNWRDWTAANYVYSWYNPKGTENNGGEKGYPNIAGVLDGECAFRPDDEAATGCNTSAYVKSMNAYGHCGYKTWRMPTISELKSIHRMDSGNSESVPDSSFFPNTDVREGIGYFSSTPSADNSASAWCFDTSTGQVRLCQKQTVSSVRLVRSEAAISAEQTVQGGN
jgi:hypothetical protein